MNGSEEDSTDRTSKKHRGLKASSGKAEDCSVTKMGAKTGTMGDKARKVGWG